jgi:hypothetical protein
MHGLRRAAEAEGRRLLRILFLWRCAVSPDSASASERRAEKLLRGMSNGAGAHVAKINAGAEPAFFISGCQRSNLSKARPGSVESGTRARFLT